MLEDSLSENFDTFKLEVMHISATPMAALTLPTMPGLTSNLTSLPMTSQLGSEAPVLFYTFAQPPPPSPGLTAGLSQGLPASVVNPMVSSGVSSGLSPGVGSASPPSAVVPDIMQLINYGDKDLGLLLSQR